MMGDNARGDPDNMTSAGRPQHPDAGNQNGPLRGLIQQVTSMTRRWRLDASQPRTAPPPPVAAITAVTAAAVAVARCLVLAGPVGPHCRHRDGSGHDADHGGHC